MDTNVSDYLQRRLRRGRELVLPRTMNAAGRVYPARNAKSVIDKCAKNFMTSANGDKWIVMPGLRGVGKTTLLAQVYMDITNSEIKANLLHVSLEQVVENLNSNLYELLNAYERILGCDLEAVDRPTFIFIDEVQADPKWARTLKTVYDNTTNVFLFCTGSSAVHLQMDADIAGRRARIEKLYPLSFVEFQLLKYGLTPTSGLREEIITALYQSHSADESYRRLKSIDTQVRQEWVKYSKNNLNAYFETGTLPVTFEQDNPVRINDNLRAMIDKVIDTDMRTLKHFSYESLASIKKLLFILADSGDIISAEKLSQALGVGRSQIFAFLDALVKAELLIKIPPCGSHLTASRRPAKYLFMSPAIRNFYYSITDTKTAAVRKGLLLEDLAGLHYQRDLVATGQGGLTYDHENRADFIAQLANGQRLAVEFGMGKKDIAQVAATTDKMQCDRGLVFADIDLAYSAGKYLKIPLDYFFLI